MAFPTDDILLGPQSFGARASTAGIIFHTTEGGGWSRAAAVATAKWQMSNPGSYNFIVYDTDSPGSKGGALLTVPYMEASGGINPFSPYYKPERYPWLQNLLGNAYNDPAKHHIQISFSGRTRDIVAGNMPENMFDTAARLVLWIESQPWSSDGLILSGHMHWQSNRSDPGVGTIEKVLDRYTALKAPPPMPTREERLAREVVQLRKMFPAQAERWYRNTGLSPNFDSSKFTREHRLAAEVTFLREFK